MVTRFDLYTWQTNDDTNTNECNEFNTTKIRNSCQYFSNYYALEVYMVTADYRTYQYHVYLLLLEMLPDIVFEEKDIFS